MNVRQKLELFKELNEALPDDKRFVFDFFSNFLPINYGSMPKSRDISREIFCHSDYLLSDDRVREEDYDVSDPGEDYMGYYKFGVYEPFVDAEIKKINAFLLLLKKKKIAISYSLKKLAADDIKVEDPFDHERRELISSGRVLAHDIFVSLDEKNAYFLQEFADTFIVGQSGLEFASENKQKKLVAVYILRKYFDLNKENFTLNLYSFFSMKYHSSSSIDDRQYLSPEHFKKIKIMKILRELASQDYFSIKSAIYCTKDFKIFPDVIDIHITSEQARKIKDSYLEKSVRKNNNKSLKSIHLVTESIVVKDVMFLVLDERYEAPIRFKARDNQGKDTCIKKLHNIAYFANVPDKKVDYDKKIADNINNGIFKKKLIRDYMKTNDLKKPTLVMKSEDGKILVPKNEITVQTILINKVPIQLQFLYRDKTK